MKWVVPALLVAGAGALAWYALRPETRPTPPAAQREAARRSRPKGAWIGDALTVVGGVAGGIFGGPAGAAVGGAGGRALYEGGRAVTS